MRLEDIDRAEIQVEDAVKNPDLISPWLIVVIPLNHFLDVALTQHIVFVVDEVDERNAGATNCIESLTMSEIINEVGTNTASHLWFPAVKCELVKVEGNLFGGQIGIDEFGNC